MSTREILSSFEFILESAIVEKNISGWRWELVSAFILLFLTFQYSNKYKTLANLCFNQIIDKSSSLIVWLFVFSQLRTPLWVALQIFLLLSINIAAAITMKYFFTKMLYSKPCIFKVMICDDVIGTNANLLWCRHDKSFRNFKFAYLSFSCLNIIMLKWNIELLERMTWM